MKNSTKPSKKLRKNVISCTLDNGLVSYRETGVAYDAQKSCVSFFGVRFPGKHILQNSVAFLAFVHETVNCRFGTTLWTEKI